MSYKRGKAYATKSKVIMGNGGFYSCVSESQGVPAWWKETAQTHVFIPSRSLLLNHLEPQSIKAKLLLPIMPIGIVAYALTLSWDNLCRNSFMSHRRSKAHATMSKGTVGKSGFYGCLIVEGDSAWWKEKAQARVFMLSPSLLLSRLEPQSSKAKLLLPIIPIGIATYGFTHLLDNLCRNSCIRTRSLIQFEEFFSSKRDLSTW